MTSLLSHTKQIPANAGYYISVGNAIAAFYANVGTDAVPDMSGGAMLAALNAAQLNIEQLSQAGNAIFKDMGKTLVSAGRTYRKVQLVVPTLVSPSEGVGGEDVAPTNYLTGYIELPGQHGLTTNFGTCTPVARLG